MLGPLEFAVCRHCRTPIAHVGDQAWLHTGPDLMPLPAARGCRAASFDDQTGWDETLRRTWTATPEPGTVTRDLPPRPTT